MPHLFLFQENVHNIRNFQVIFNKNINTVRYGLETIYHRTFFWGGKLPTYINFAASLSDFKTKI